MILWLNGAFGAGKTQTAFALQRRLPGSYVYDPENIGYCLAHNVPPALAEGDFQDYPMWREFNLRLLDDIASRYGGHIIVPMTVTNRAYYDELVGALSQRHEVRHFILWAERKTLLRRLARRLEGRHSWAARQIDRCMQAFERDVTGVKIHTDRLDVEQTAERVAALAGLALLEDKRSRPRRLLDRAITQIRHIR
nr:AAA family ATPase [Acutalibacter muris]